jgi:hypothetical protein
MGKKVGDKRLSSEDGYEPAGSYILLDRMLYEVVKELRDTISTLQDKIDAQEVIITELKNGGGGSNGLSFADIVRGKATVATAAVVAMLDKEQTQQTIRGDNLIISGLAESKEGASDDEAVKAVFAAIGVELDQRERKGVESVRRVGRKPATTENRPRALVVRFERMGYEMKSKVLKNASTLKEKAEYSTVYIKRDTTDNVRMFEYELRKRRISMNTALSEVDRDGRRYAIDKSGKKWYWGVRWGELHHIDKATGRALKIVM